MKGGRVIEMKKGPCGKVTGNVEVDKKQISLTNAVVSRSSH
jgi:hypothetical protein